MTQTTTQPASTSIPCLKQIDDLQLQRDLSFSLITVLAAAVFVVWFTRFSLR